MPRVSRRSKEGFTLVEILVSIAVFAIGGVAILALFIAMAERSRQSIDITRGTEIASNVRETIAASMRLPPRRVDEHIYRQISLPFATLDANLEDRAETALKPDYRDGKTNTYYYELPTEAFKGAGIEAPDSYTVLPRQLKDLDLREVRVGPGGSEPQVFHYLPSPIKKTQLSKEADDERVEDVDYDHSEAYSFAFFIRRSVQRSEFQQKSGRAKRLVPGLFVVQVLVFKGYLPGRENYPIVEETFTIYAPDRENLTDTD